jgi:hypothetical protein
VIPLLFYEFTPEEINMIYVEDMSRGIASAPLPHQPTVNKLKKMFYRKNVSQREENRSAKGA